MSVQVWTHVPSKSLGMRTSVTVITPEGSVADPVAWPASKPGVAILLHGLTGNYSTWTNKTDLTTLATRHNLVLVLPDGARSFWLNQEFGLKYGQWVGEELPQIIRATLRVSRSRSKTFIGGFSMGGYGAFHAVMDYPQTFGGAFALSGVLDVAEPQFRDRHPDLYQIGFGNPDTPRPQDDLLARVKAGDFGLEGGGSGSESGGVGSEGGGVVSEGENLGSEGQDDKACGPQQTKLFAACGESDRLLGQNRRFREAAQDAGLKLEYHEGPGAHTHEFWNSWLPKALKSVTSPA